MAIKLIALDMDGTLLKDDKTISGRAIEALKHAVGKGIMVVPATGRVAKMIPKPVASIPGIRYAITSNGALVRDLRDRSAFYTNLMTTEQSNRLIRFFSRYGLFMEAYCSGVSFADGDVFDLVKKEIPDFICEYIMESQTFVKNLPGYLSSRKIQLEKINVPYVPHEYRSELIEKLSEMPEYCVTSSGKFNIEVNASSCSKGEALKFLCTKLSISPSQVMSVGDSDNDESMLQFSGLAVAMGNASSSVRLYADYVTYTNNEDGAAYAVEKFALSGI